MVYLRELGIPQQLICASWDMEGGGHEVSGTFQITMEEDWQSWSKLIKACVLTSKTPLTFYEINKSVKMLEGRDIPYEQLNYKSFEEMMNNISGLEVFWMNSAKLVKARTSEQARFQVSIQRRMQYRKQKSKKYPWNNNVLLPNTGIRFLACLCVLFLGGLSCFNMLLLRFDAPNIFNIRNGQTAVGTHPKCPLKAPAVPSIGSIFDVRITKAANPGNFTIQRFKNVYKLETLMIELSRFCESYSGPPLTPSSLKVGNLYAAKYGNNGRWYRAYISKIINKTVCVVYFCDYGDYKVVALKQLRPLENRFYDLPYQAIKAKLHGITPKSKSGWTVQDSLRFSELIITKNFVSIIKSREVESSTGEMILGLELIDVSPSEGIYITNVLVNENRADRLE